MYEVRKNKPKSRDPFLAMAVVQFKDLSIGKGNNFIVTRIHRDSIRVLMDVLVTINNRLDYNMIMKDLQEEE